MAEINLNITTADRPSATPADFFAHLDDPGTPEGRQRAMNDAFDRWKVAGVSQVRVTLTGPNAMNDNTGYPAGLWLEGWKDVRAVQLPFGAGYPDEGGPLYPPLVSA